MGPIILTTLPLFSKTQRPHKQIKKTQTQTNLRGGVAAPSRATIAFFFLTALPLAPKLSRPRRFQTSLQDLAPLKYYHFLYQICMF